ncbi:hypothetical protein MCOR25_007419 [Pyricularia grisea]|uniref:Uncharacterized protein n=1 Tax=Pyricularia grisea TaxID=148305 RepID=A0A6P8BCP3_PYRGI|nr:uncharacterized protein PgNI_03639 [Pyricularia grisea]KAI6358184.1 hypothetical protein MCOR25_007419 [Pyricularia grisea]TLD13472.1 hypothetical protein PgNI_03639 [Pyricularia grisea]
MKLYYALLILGDLAQSSIAAPTCEKELIQPHATGPGQKIGAHLHYDPADKGSCPHYTRDAQNGYCDSDTSMIAFHFGEEKPSVQDNDGTQETFSPGEAVGLLCCIPSHKLLPFSDYYRAQYRTKNPEWDGQCAPRDGWFHNGYRGTQKKPRRNCFAACCCGLLEACITSKHSSSGTSNDCLCLGLAGGCCF